MAKLIITGCVSLFFSMGTYALTTAPDFSKEIPKLDKLIGLSGQLDSKTNTYTVSAPRDDLNIIVNGMPMTSEMGLTSWVTFKRTDDQALVYGELVLLQDQVNPVMSVALEHGLKVTALHNPFLWDSPRVLLMHISGEGDQQKLAEAMGSVFKKIEATKNGAGDFPMVNNENILTTLDPLKIEQTLGVKGSLKDGVYKIMFGKNISDDDVSKQMAANTWAAFKGTDSEAMVDGIIALRETELQKVLLTLRKSQFYILAIYEHILRDDSAVVLVHYWGIGDTAVLAKSIGVAIAQSKDRTPDYIQAISKRFALNLPVADYDTCHGATKTLAQNVYPDYDAFPYKALQDKTHERLVASGFSSLIPVAKEVVYNYTGKLTAGFTFALVSGTNEVYKKTTNSIKAFFTVENKIPGYVAPAVKQVFPSVIPVGKTQIVKAPPASNVNKDPTIDTSFANTEFLRNQIAVALYIPKTDSVQSDFLSALLSAQNKKYNYVENITRSSPVIFSEEVPPKQTVSAKPQHTNFELLTDKIATVLFMTSENNSSSGLLSALLAAEHKEYNYAEKIAQAAPVVFPVESSVNVAEDAEFKNNELLTKQLATAMNVEYNVPVYDGFVSTVIAAQQINYNYVEKIAMASPVVFTSEPEITPVAEKDSSFKNTELLTHTLASALHIDMSASANNVGFLSMLIDANHIDYHYAEKMAIVAPVVFPAEVQAPAAIVQAENFNNTALLTTKLSAALYVENNATQASGFLPAVLASQQKDYNYLKQLTSASPVFFFESVKVSGGVALAQVKTSEILLNTVAHALYLRKKSTNTLDNPALASLPTSKVLSYDHVALLMKTSPVTFPVVDETKMISVALNQYFSNSELLARKLSTTLHIVNANTNRLMDAFSSKSLLAKNNDYDYVRMLVKGSRDTFIESQNAYVKEVASAKVSQPEPENVKALVAPSPVIPVVSRARVAEIAMAPSQPTAMLASFVPPKVITKPVVTVAAANNPVILHNVQTAHYPTVVPVRKPKALITMKTSVKPSLNPVQMAQNKLSQLIQAHTQSFAMPSHKRLARNKTFEVAAQNVSPLPVFSHAPQIKVAKQRSVSMAMSESFSKKKVKVASTKKAVARHRYVPIYSHAHRNYRHSEMLPETFHSPAPVHMVQKKVNRTVIADDPYPFDGIQ